MPANRPNLTTYSTSYTSNLTETHAGPSDSLGSNSSYTSWANYLLRMLNTDVPNIGTKPIAIRNPANPRCPPFTVRIPPDKESSKREAQATQDEIQVFTDGSIIEGKVGAAAILTRSGHAHRTLHLHHQEKPHSLATANEQ